MSKKTFALVSGIIGALQTADVAIVTYAATFMLVAAINSAIVIVGAAVIEACNLFVKA